jgi:hypothetical protein
MTKLTNGGKRIMRIMQERQLRDAKPKRRREKQTPEQAERSVEELMRKRRGLGWLG